MKKLLITVALCTSLFSGASQAGLVLMAGGLTAVTVDAIKQDGAGLSTPSVVGALVGGALGGTLAGIAALALGINARIGGGSPANIFIFVLDDDGGVRNIDTYGLDEGAIPVLEEAIAENFTEEEMRALVGELSNPEY
ncbi:MAG: hypothetical protein HOE90_20265 [Bacteriovoracaceae bacterium]|jgi:hypothetical protein|nr:hypothetical protein [Bacteriovoracaceae bacterium]